MGEEWEKSGRRVGEEWEKSGRRVGEEWDDLVKSILALLLSSGATVKNFSYISAKMPPNLC